MTNTTKDEQEAIAVWMRGLGYKRSVLGDWKRINSSRKHVEYLSDDQAAHLYRAQTAAVQEARRDGAAGGEGVQLFSGQT